MCDRNAAVREAAAEAMENMFILIGQRDTLHEQVRQALKQIEAGFEKYMHNNLLFIPF